MLYLQDSAQQAGQESRFIYIEDLGLGVGGVLTDLDDNVIQRALFQPLPRFGDSYTLIGSWIVDDEACGMGICEDNTLITKDTSRFVPHYIAG